MEEIDMTEYAEREMAVQGGRKLWLTVGLAASGKSTWAAQFQSEHPNTIRVVTRDDIRASMGTQFPHDEKIVSAVAEFAAKKFLEARYNVIIADTNLSPKVRRRWEQLAKTVSSPNDWITVIEKQFDTPLATCLERNKIRWENGDCKVPDSAIIAMDERWER